MEFCRKVRAHLSYREPQETLSKAVKQASVLTVVDKVLLVGLKKKVLHLKSLNLLER